MIDRNEMNTKILQTNQILASTCSISFLFDIFDIYSTDMTFYEMNLTNYKASRWSRYKKAQYNI